MNVERQPFSWPRENEGKNKQRGGGETSIEIVERRLINGAFAGESKFVDLATHDAKIVILSVPFPEICAKNSKEILEKRFHDIDRSLKSFSITYIP